MEGTSSLTRSRVVAIGLAACDLSLLTRLVDRGALPEIGRVLADGRLTETAAAHHPLGAAPWTEMLTGCTPETTGYWSPLAYRPDYTLREVGAYDFAECRPLMLIAAAAGSSRSTSRRRGCARTSRARSSSAGARTAGAARRNPARPGFSRK